MIRLSVTLLAVALVLLASACGSGDDTPITIKSAETARGFRDGKAVDPTTTFSPKDNPLHCVITLSRGRDGTRVRAVWVIVDAGGEKNLKLDEAEVMTSDGQNVIDHTLSLPGDWPVGKYKVDLYVNDELARTVDFTIR